MQIRALIRLLGIVLIVFFLLLFLHIYLKLLKMEQTKTPKPAPEQKSSFVVKNLQSDNLNLT
jgi:hypothetical protein